MKKHIPVLAEEAPASGTAQIHARYDSPALAAAEPVDRNMVTVEHDPQTSARRHSITTQCENRTYPDLIAEHFSLGEALLCHGPESARLLCEAALGLIAALEASMLTLLRISRTIDQDGRLPTSLESAAIEKIRAAAIGGIDDFERAVRRPPP